MKTKIKYSKELLEPIVRESISIQQVMRKLGLALAGGTNTHLKGVFKKFNIDTSHFLGQASTKGKINSCKRKLDWKIYLTYDRHNGRKENSRRLKIAMIESGIIEKCQLCNITNIWNNKKLVLQIDHIDGNPINNIKDNLRFLCPNCHSQTETFAGKNIKKNKER